MFPQQLSRAFPVSRRVDVQQLRLVAAGQADELGPQRSGQGLDREALPADLLLDDRQGPDAHQKGKACRAIERAKNGVPPRAQAAQQPREQADGDERHVTGQEQFRIGPTGFKRGVDATKRSASSNQIPPDDPHRPACFPCRSANQSKQRMPSQPQPGLVPSHPRAEPSGQNAERDPALEQGLLCLPADLVHAAGLARRPPKIKVALPGGFVSFCVPFGGAGCR